MRVHADSGAKKPQLGQDQPQVVPGAAHHRMQRIAQGAFERVSGQSPVHFHVPDRRLNGAAPVDHGPQGSGDAALLARAQDTHPDELHAPVALVNDGRRGLVIGQDAHLLQRFFQRVPVVRIARHRAHAYDQPFLQRRGDAHLHAELVRCSGLAFGDAFDFGCVQGVQLVFVFAGLREDAAGASEQVADLGLCLRGQRDELSRDFALDSSHPDAQRAQRLLHALELLGVGVAPDLCSQAGLQRGCSSGAAPYRALRPPSPDAGDSSPADDCRWGRQSLWA